MIKSQELAEGEFNPYYKRYIDLVDAASLFEGFEEGKAKTLSFFENLPEEKLAYRYAEGKWTPKDILQHIVDTERVFAYRALYFARDTTGDLKGFDENIFAQNTSANSRNLKEMLDEYIAVRNSTISLFKSFEEPIFLSIGLGNNSPMSVRAAGFIICGHEIHHRNIIKERYLK